MSFRCSQVLDYVQIDNDALKADVYWWTSNSGVKLAFVYAVIKKVYEEALFKVCESSWQQS